MSVKTKKGTEKQKFIRLNLDENLDNLLQKYQEHYKLLSKTDIVRMLLSEVDFIRENNLENPKKSFKEILQGSNFIDIEDENEQSIFNRRNF